MGFVRIIILNSNHVRLMPPHIHPAPVFRLRDEADRKKLQQWRGALRVTGKKLVFTNGVFDILHKGHVTYLAEARNLGAALLVGVNADGSVKRLKGDSRPVQTEEDRAAILASLRFCDAVAIFDEDTPLELISLTVPDILVKGGDYTLDTIVGRDVVESHGGSVLTIPLVEGRSTTNIIGKIEKP